MKIHQVKTEVALIEELSNESLPPSRVDKLWLRFFNLYYWPMMNYVEKNGGGAFASDIVQVVLIKLTAVFRQKAYHHDPERPFRAYLMKLLKRTLIDYVRNEKLQNDKKEALLKEVVEYPDVAEQIANQLDSSWYASLHERACDMVLSHGCVPAIEKNYYRDYIDNKLSYKEIAAKYHVSYDKVRRRIIKIENLVSKMEMYMMKSEKSEKEGAL